MPAALRAERLLRPQPSLDLRDPLVRDAARIGIDDERAARQMTKASGRASFRSKRSRANGERSRRRRHAGDELRDVLADSRRLLEAVAREARRVEETARPLGFADDRVVVRAHLVVAPPRGLHRQLAEHRQAPRGRDGELLEALLAAAEGDSGAFAVEVEAGREVDGQRQPRRQPAVRRREVHPALLAADRNVHAGHRADLPRPGAGAADDRLRRDPALGRLDGHDPAFGDIDADDVAALADVEAARVPLHDVLGRDVAVELAEGRREQAFRLELRDDRDRLVHRQLARRHAQRVLEGERGAEPLDVAPRCRGERDTRAGGARRRPSPPARRGSAGRSGCSARRRTAS